MTPKGGKKEKASGTGASETPSMEETPENLDKVRDILFGGQMRAVDQRLASLEGRFQRDLDALRSDTEKRQEGLEGFIRKEVDALDKKLRTEREKRSDELKALSKEVKNGFKNLEKQLDKLDDTSSSADADLRTAILEHTQAVSQQIQQLADRFSDELHQAKAELRGDKLDTTTLVQLLSTMALNLSEDIEAGTEQD